MRQSIFVYFCPKFWPHAGFDPSRLRQDSTLAQERIADSEWCRYLASPEVVAASALSGKISGPGWYQQPEGISGVVMGEGDGVKEEERIITTEEAMEQIIGQLDHRIETAESEKDATEAKTKEVEILSGFPSKVAGEILLLDADNLNVSYKFPLLFPHSLKLGDTS